MARVTKALAGRKKHKKILKKASGYYGARSRLVKTAKQANIKSLQYAFRDRKAKKRSFRSLWISRINSATRMHGLSYSSFLDKLNKNNIKLNRKILSDLATNDLKVFESVIKIVQK